MQDFRLVSTNTFVRSGQQDSGKPEVSGHEVASATALSEGKVGEEHQGGSVGIVGGMTPNTGLQGIGQLSAQALGSNVMQTSLPSNFWRQAFENSQTSVIKGKENSGNENQGDIAAWGNGSEQPGGQHSFQEMLDRLDTGLDNNLDFNGMVMNQMMRVPTTIGNLLKPTASKNTAADAEKPTVTKTKIDASGNVVLASGKKSSESSDGKAKKSSMDIINELTQQLLNDEQGRRHAEKLFASMGIVNQIQPLGLVNEFFPPEEAVQQQQQR